LAEATRSRGTRAPEGQRGDPSSLATQYGPKADDAKRPKGLENEYAL
jgi:hypothetical protein